MNGQRTRGQRLLLRVYFHGILMLTLAGSASFVVGSYLIKPVIDVPTRPSTAWIAWHLGTLVDQPEVLNRELADLARRARIEMSLFEADGRLIATNAPEPQAALSAAEFRRLSEEPTHFAEGAGVVALPGQAGGVARYVRIKYPSPVLPLVTAAAQLCVALAVLAFASIPLARSVIAPVERLATLTRAFGAGNLAVRARSERADEIGDLARAFDEMAERIVTLRRSEKELLANVSHELRTPLARIRLALELAREGDAARAASYLEDIEDDLAELERLLDDVMTAARLDLARGAGGDPLPPLRRQPIAAQQLLQAASARFAKRFPERTLSCHIPEDLPAVDGDPSLLRRVLDNLLDNAAKFSDPDKVIELEGSHDDQARALSIRVRDHGIGIEPGDLERVFEPFFRSDRSRTRATGGVGLGLAVVRRIVLAHGGAVSVESNPAWGTCFHVSVPCHAAASAA
jgi:two-component system OmpR family sensor kinase